MPTNQHAVRSRTALAIVAVMMLITSVWAAADEKVLRSFNGRDGYYPNASLISDASGDLYGTTSYGGDLVCNNSGCGTAFELVPKAGGGWSEKVLHNFSSNGEDGYFPLGGLIFDKSGNLYGITVAGGTGSCNSIARGVGCGAVFQLKPAANGDWKETVLYSFNNDGADGEYPQAGLVLDASGNLYGTTVAGGAESSGTVFELMPKAGKWEETILYSFNNNGSDGFYPDGGLTLRPSGDIYGTTYYGGPWNFGTVFELKRTTGGWKESVLHSFNGSDGRAPEATLIFDALGNLYGTTQLGGGNSYGTVFELTAGAGGKLEESVLHSFTGNDQDGSSPEAGLVFDGSGNLYGTTVSGGAGGCLEGTGCGTVFELTPAAGGGWTAKVLYSFSDDGKDGIYPQAGLLIDASGNLFGTTSGGGGSTACQDQCGSIFEIQP